MDFHSVPAHAFRRLEFDGNGTPGDLYYIAPGGPLYLAAYFAATSRTMFVNLSELLNGYTPGVGLVLQAEVFVGDGSTTTFYLAGSPSGIVLWFLNGVLINAPADYSTSGNAMAMMLPPEGGPDPDVLTAVYQS